MDAPTPCGLARLDAKLAAQRQRQALHLQFAMHTKYSFNGPKNREQGHP